MKILVFGSINIDKVYAVDHIVLPGETITSSSLKESAGGKGSNQAASLAKAGADVSIACKPGKDGLWILDKLNSFGVKTDLSLSYDGPTGQAIIQLDNKGQNSIFLFPGGNSKITEEEIIEVLDKFNSGDWLVINAEIGHERFLIEEGYKRKMKVCFNPSPFYNYHLELPLDKTSLLIVNEIEGALLAGCNEKANMEYIAKELMKKFPNTEVVLTAGKHGAYAVSPESKEIAYSPIFDLPPKDTTGAGDTFLGYYLHSRNNLRTPQEALNIASKASGIAVSRFGAMDAIPFAEELKDF